jgi:hypothetical protein
MNGHAAVLNRSADEQRQFVERFRALAERWKRDTLVLSNPTAMEQHPAYQEIIRMGPGGDSANPG